MKTVKLADGSIGTVEVGDIGDYIQIDIDNDLREEVGLPMIAEGRIIEIIEYNQ